MKKLSFSLLLLLSVLAVTITGCKNNIESEYQDYLDQYYKAINDQYVKDTVIIKDYLANHGLTALKDTSGIFYIIGEPGNAEHPADSDTIEVKYKGYLTDNVIFDQTATDTTFTSKLSYLIPGWRVGIPLIGKGGTIKLFLPSYFGYGSVTYGAIPANSVTIFEIELIDF